MIKLATAIFDNHNGFRLDNYSTGTLYDMWEVNTCYGYVYSPRKFKILNFETRDIVIIKFEDKETPELFMFSNKRHLFITLYEWREKMYSMNKYHIIN